MAKALIQGKINRFGVPALCASLLALGAGAAAATTTGSAKTCSSPTTALNFQTVRFHPPHVHVCTRKAHEAHGAIFLAPIRNSMGGHMVGQPGAILEDQGGHVIWFHPAPKGLVAADFQAATFDKQPVITFWQGKLAIPPHNLSLPAGTPIKGSIYVYNDHYQKIKTINAVGKGWVTDFHDLVFTAPTKTYSQGTALILAVKRESGGAPGGFVDDEIQEINLATGKLVWKYDVHNKAIPFSASNEKKPSSASTAWDPYHANSLDIKAAGGLADGDVLLSLRNTWGIYEISHKTKKIVWKLVTGAHSTYKLSKSAQFHWQHDVHYVGKNQLSIFDDNCCNTPSGGYFGPARGLLLTLKNKSATVARTYHHPNTKAVPSLGSYRVLSDGHAFIGWGQSPYFSEYSNAGMIYDAALPKSDISYRALKARWTGLPGVKAIGVAARKLSGKPVVYASWNGATNVAKWRVLAGKTAGKVTKVVATVAKTSFETDIHVTNPGPYYRVEALDSHGHVLGTSKVTKL